MNEKDLEFSLDDIVKEFHDESNGPLILEEDLVAPEIILEDPPVIPEEPEAVLEEPKAALEPADTVIFDPAEPAVDEAEETDVTGDTIRLDDLSQVDAVVLGCTHYVFLRPLLKEILPPIVSVLDGNEGTARQLRRVLTANDLLADGQGSVTLETSGNPALVIPVMQRLLDK